MVAHFDHRLRPSSAEDAAFVADLAERLQLPHRLGAADQPLDRIAGRSLEEAARHARYEFLSRQAQELGASFVATGHTADDQVETVLFSILRGCGIHGLAGMPAVRELTPGVQLIRPMLDVRRAQVKEFLSTIDAPFRVDESNADRAMTRNRIRSELLPLLRDEYQPSVDSSLLRLSQTARAVAGWLTHEADALLARVLLSRASHELSLDAAALAAAAPVLAAEAIRRLLENESWPRAEVGHDELTRIVALCRADRRTAIDLPGKIRAEFFLRPAPRLRLLRTR
jgi:tRNA(Ile)-lysidine synthase